MNKQTDWKDGNAFILNDGKKLTVCGQGRARSQSGALVFAEEYDDELKLIKNRDIWKDKLDVAKIISAKEIMPDEWDGKPIRGKAWNGSDKEAVASSRPSGRG